jgi:hypothetical protein
MKFISLITSLLLVFSLYSQKKFSNKKKVSNAKNTLFAYWGYNRSFYTKSDIRFKGQGYDFTLSNATASDNPSTDIKQYVNLKSITVPQFNTRIGYYYKDQWCISLGYDHMKYLFDNNNQVMMSGVVNEGVDSLWSGIYENRPTITNANHFHYENSNGLNYIRLELMRSLKLYQTRDKLFAITGNFSFGSGMMLTISDFNFQQQFDRYKASISGFGFSSHLSIRFEFWRHFFIQPEFSGGWINLTKVKLRKSDPKAIAKHHFWYYQNNITIGALFYLKPKNGCMDCPNW